MTDKAIKLLGQDRDGSFLRVESASINKRDHASDLCGQIGETKQLDDAVKVALAFQRRNPNTLVVVTADHRTRSRSWVRCLTRRASMPRSRRPTASRCV